MQSTYKLSFVNPLLDTLGYVVAIANIEDKHDRSTPSHYHWKVLKCRMMIFSYFDILACPEKKEIRQIHVIFNKFGDSYDKLNSLFIKYSLVQEGEIRTTTSEIFQRCFEYTMTAKLAPIWNVLGHCYLVNNRDFLTATGPQDGVRYHISSTDYVTCLELKPVKINLIRSDDNFLPGEWIRVLPSLNKAILEENLNSLPASGNFKCYKDMRRHWKNIHGYRLPEQEDSYCTVQFWRGEPLTYPKLCLTRNFPIITPMPKSNENIMLSSFVSCLKNKMPHILGVPLKIQFPDYRNDSVSENLSNTQVVSLCTPTQLQRLDTTRRK